MKQHSSLLSATALASILLLCLGAKAQAQVLLDGSFESPGLVSSTAAAGGGTYWTSTGNVCIIANDFDNFGNTPYGVQYLHVNSGGTDSQTITGFVAGQTYVLGAHYADVQGAGAVLNFSVSGAATDSGNFTVASGGRYGSGQIAFDSAVLVFTATSTGSATITIKNTGDNGLVVDDVALYGSTGSNGSGTLPEPATTSLVLFGMIALAGLGFRARAAARSSR